MDLNFKVSFHYQARNIIQLIIIPDRNYIAIGTTITNKNFKQNIEKVKKTLIL